MRRWAVGLWLAVMAVCAVLVLRASFTADMSAFLPQAPTAEQRQLVDQLRDGLVSRLVLVGIEGADGPARAALSRGMAQALRQDKQFVAVHNGENVGTERDQAFFFQNRYLLSPAVTPERFTAAGMNAAIQESLDLLASPAGLLVKDLLPRDPTGEIAVVIDALGAQSASARNRPATADGVWASRDGSRALMLLQTRAPGGDTDAQQAAVAAIRAAFTQAKARAEGEGAGADAATLVLSGPGVFGVQVRELIEREVKRLSMAGTAMIIVLLLALYRSLPALVLGLLPVASGVLVAIAAVSLGFGTVHGLTLGFGTTLIGEAVDYSIYLFVQSRHAGADRTQWVRRFWPTVRLGALTSIFGFGALLFSGFPGLAQLGLYSIAGLTTAALVTRFVLPHLLPADFTVRDISAPGRALVSVVARAGALRWPAIALIAGSLVVIAVNHDRIWSHELASMSPVSAQDQALDQGLRADLGAPDVRFLVVIQGDSEEAVLAGSERAVVALQPLVRANVIGGVDSPSHLLPSIATQRSRQAAIPPVGELASRLAQATEGLPLRAQRLGGFLEDAEKARTARPVRLVDLEGTATGVAVGGMLTRRDGAQGSDAWSAILPLHGPRADAAGGNIDPAQVKAVLPPVDAGGATRTLFVDLKGEADALYSNYQREAAWLSLGGLVAIAVLIAVSLRSVRRMVAVMLPLAGTVAILVAALVLAGHRLTILHLVGLLLVFAVGSNYVLFFSRGAGEDEAGEEISPTTLASLLFANVAAVLGFGILALAQVPVLQAIGITVGPGAVLALVLAAVFAAPKRTP